MVYFYLKRKEIGNISWHFPLSGKKFSRSLRTWTMGLGFQNGAWVSVFSRPGSLFSFLSSRGSRAQGRSHTSRPSSLTSSSLSSSFEGWPLRGPGRESKSSLFQNGAKSLNLMYGTHKLIEFLKIDPIPMSNRCNCTYFDTSGLVRCRRTVFLLPLNRIWSHHHVRVL